MVAFKLSALLALSAFSSVMAISAQYHLEAGEGVAWFETLSISGKQTGPKSFTQCRTACANASDKCIGAPRPDRQLIADRPGFTWTDSGDVCKFLGLPGAYSTQSTGAAGPVRRFASGRLQLTPVLAPLRVPLRGHPARLHLRNQLHQPQRRVRPLRPGLHHRDRRQELRGPGLGRPAPAHAPHARPPRDHARRGEHPVVIARRCILARVVVCCPHPLLSTRIPPLCTFVPPRRSSIYCTARDRFIGLAQVYRAT